MTNQIDDRTSDYSGLPEKRIQCSSGKILIGGKEYLSATEALLSYLQQFESRTRSTQQQHAYELLVARSKMATRRSHELTNEVKDSVIAVRKRRFKQMLERKKDHHLGLKREVEDALTRSADLLVRINNDDDDDDDDDDAPCASDIGSLSTELLLTSNPLAVSGQQKTAKHVYSYRAPRSRFRTLDTTSHAPKSRPSSVDSITIDSEAQTERKHSEERAHRRLRLPPPDNMKQFRSRSESPSHLRIPGLPSSQPENKKTSLTPSWVNRLDLTSDPLEQPRAPPSWVNDVDKSDITAESLLLDFKKNSSINKSNLTDSRPGLNFSDLATNELSMYSNARDLRSGGDNRDTSRLATKVDVNDDVQLTTSLDRYLERLEAETALLTKTPTGPKCSSMELSPSRQRPPKSDISGASSIRKNCNNVTSAEEQTILSNKVRFSPSTDGGREVRDHLQGSPGTEIILNTERPWDVVPISYKSPVYIKDSSNLRHGNKAASPTLTGSEQPGSMEALKNMLFKLQAEETTMTTGCEVGAMTNPLDLPALQDYNFQAEPGGQSLEKALVHLSRLKNLVQHTQLDSASVVTGTSAYTS